LFNNDIVALRSSSLHAYLTVFVWLIVPGCFVQKLLVIIAQVPGRQSHYSSDLTGFSHDLSSSAAIKELIDDSMNAITTTTSTSGWQQPGHDTAPVWSYIDSEREKDSIQDERFPY